MTAYWQNKKVLITGADGFIGSHLVEHLQNAGASVRALVLYNSFNSYGWLEDVKEISHVEIISGDIRDIECCMRITQNIDVIFHLASLIAIPYSFQNPRSYVDTNIYGTLNLCQAALNTRSKLTYISSSEVYGTAKYVPIDENHPLQAQSPYSATKIGAEAIAYSFFRTYNLPVSIIRPFNTYGPRQSARAIIPSVIIQMLGKGNKIKIGNTKVRRDFNYVTDTCSGILAVAENENLVGETINIGSGADYSIAEICKLLSKLMDKEIILHSDPSRIRPANAEVDLLQCDNGKIKKQTAFEPKVKIEEGLENTLAWFGKNKNRTTYKNKIYNV